MLNFEEKEGIMAEALGAAVMLKKKWFRGVDDEKFISVFTSALRKILRATK